MALGDVFSVFPPGSSTLPPLSSLDLRSFHGQVTEEDKGQHGGQTSDHVMDPAVRGIDALYLSFKGPHLRTCFRGFPARHLCPQVLNTGDDAQVVGH